MKTRALLAVLLASIVAPAPPNTAAPNAAYRVVVNTDNPAAALGREALARIFLKKDKSWPSGQPAQPVDQSATSSVRKAFSREVLGKEMIAIESYWQQAIFSGRAFPPLVKSSDAEVLAFVRANAGAVGYVSGDADLGTSVRELGVK